MITLNCHVELDGLQTEVVVTGSCQRDFTKRIACEILNVCLNGFDVFKFVTDKDRASIRVKLVSQYLANRHPLGDSIESEL